MRIELTLFGILLIAGCSAQSVPMVGVYQTSYLHRIEGTFNKEQVGELILEGAEYAGWVARDQGNNNILATYHIRVHTVIVNINYTEEGYSVNYKSSNLMKMACTHWDNSYGRYRVSGENNCPENQPPEFIHEAYKTWVDSLADSINRSLETGQ